MKKRSDDDTFPAYMEGSLPFNKPCTPSSSGYGDMKPMQLFQMYHDGQPFSNLQTIGRLSVEESVFSE